MLKSRQPHKVTSGREGERGRERGREGEREGGREGGREREREGEVHFKYEQPQLPSQHNRLCFQ